MFLMLFDPSAVKTYRAKGVGIVQTILYTTQDWKPIELNDLKTIDEFCAINKIKNIDIVHALLIKAAAILENKGSKENNVSNENNEGAIPMESVLDVLLAGLDPNSDQYAELNTQYQHAISELGATKLIKPVNPINKILAARMSNPPENLMTLFTALKNTHFEWSKIANPSKQPFKYWLLLLGVLGGISAVAIGAYLLLGDGAGTPDILEQIKAANDAGLKPPEPIESNNIGDQIFDSVSNVVKEQVGAGEQYTVLEPEPEPEPIQIEPEPEPAPIQIENSTQSNLKENDPQWLKDIEDEFR